MTTKCRYRKGSLMMRTKKPETLMSESADGVESAGERSATRKPNLMRKI